jgi:hypothetical protein
VDAAAAEDNHAIGSSSASVGAVVALRGLENCAQLAGVRGTQFSTVSTGPTAGSGDFGFRSEGAHGWRGDQCCADGISRQEIGPDFLQPARRSQVFGW